jgi:hypothetical protein
MADDEAGQIRSDKRFLGLRRRSSHRRKDDKQGGHAPDSFHRVFPHHVFPVSARA